MRASQWFTVAALSLGAFLSGAQAQILIGQTAGFSGPVAAGVKETTDGAKLYIDNVNAKGGIAGQKIELMSLDDKLFWGFDALPMLRGWLEGDPWFTSGAWEAAQQVGAGVVRSRA